MNRALRTPFMGHQPASALSSGNAASLFHSTPVLDRRRRTQWNTASSPFGHSSKSWKYDDDRGASNNSSWYKKQYWAKAAKRNGFDSQDSQWDTYRNRRKGRYEFCFSDDEEVETIFQTASGGKRGFYWSFSSEEKFHWGGSFGYENQSGSSNWRYKSEYVEDDTSTVKDVTPERLALGLSTSGPLNREEVKKAYRACALRWHPDRHEGSSKPRHTSRGGRAAVGQQDSLLFFISSTSSRSRQDSLPAASLAGAYCGFGEHMKDEARLTGF